MKILYISSENVPGITGGSVRTLEITRALKKRGHNVTIFTNRTRNQKRSETIDGMKVIRSKIRFGKTFPLLGVKRLDIFHKDFDVVIERYSIFGGIGTIYSKFHGKPLVLEVNAPHLEEAIATEAIKGRIFALAARKWRDIQFRTAAKIITTKSSLVRGYKQKAVEVVLGGVNIDIFNQRLRKSNKAKSIRKMYGLEGSFVIAFQGAFTKWHGITDLTKAVNILEGKDTNIKFLLIGSGELEKSAKSLAGNNCIFVGKKDHNEMPYYLAACDAGVAPYGILPKHLKHIGFYWTPMKVFEYMALGLPVVTADYKELRAIVGKNGLYYRLGDCSALAEALIKIKKMKRRKASVKKYSWDAQAKELERILVEVIS
jgi:glycosyltransferase involved in cell wall biosynthesis